MQDMEAKLWQVHTQAARQR